MLFIIPIKIHLYESYLYLLSASGLIDIKSAHSYNNPLIANLPSFVNYHPNHPLLILISSNLSKIAFGLNTITISILINKIFGLFSALVLYKILSEDFKDQITNILLSASFLFIDIFWYNSNASEGYVSGMFFLLLSFWLLIKAKDSKSKTLPLLHGLSLGLSIGFHSLYLFPGLIQLFLYFFYIKQLKNNYKFVILSSSIIFTLGLLIYIFPTFYIFKLSSLKDYFDLFTFYSNEMGAWTKNINKDLNFYLFPVYSGLFHILQTTFDGSHSISILLRIIFLFLFLFSFKNIFLKNLIANYFFFCFLFFFIFTAFILYLPYDITYWTFTSASVIVIIRFGIDRLKYKKVVAFVFLVSLILNNLINDILPKYQVNTEKYFFIDRIAHLTQKYKADEIGFNLYDSVSTNSYQNYYGLVWSFNHIKSHKKISFVSVDHDKLEENLNKIVSSKKSLILIENETDDLNLNSKKLDLFHKLNLKFEVIDTFTKVFEPSLDKSSEMEHDKNWYDQGPIGASWKYTVYLISPNT